MTRGYPSFKELDGGKTLILGGFRAGKTRYTVKLLLETLEIIGVEDVRVLDFAPSLFPSPYGWMGGKISEEIDLPRRLKYFSSPSIEGPRLRGKDKIDVWRRAWKNYIICKDLIDRCVKSGGMILFCNDLSIYLHFGGPEEFLNYTRSYGTLILNSLLPPLDLDDKGTGLTGIERKKVLMLSRDMDRRIDL